MNVLQKLLLLSITATLSLAPMVSDGAEKPNIIYFNADDLGVMDVGFMGRKEYRTPNLDRLAAEGMVFTEAYAPAANCAPSRAACISGQYAARHGVYTVGRSERGDSSDRKIIPIENTRHLPDENVTMAEALKAGGYKTIHLGKWHLGDDPKTQGFDINIGGWSSGGPYDGGYFSPFKEVGPMHRFNDLYPKGTHRCDIFADQAVKFMRANKKKPFFMYMSYYAVHAGFEAVPGMVEKYKGVEGIHAKYASMIEKMDESIGKIVAELDRLGLKKNTLVLFTSDNGGMRHVSTQAPYRSGKGSYFEGGIREPLLVRWPGTVKAGTTCDVPVIGIDIYPTFLDAAELDAPDGKILDGASLMPLLTQKGAFSDRAIYWHFPIYLQGYAGEGDDAHDPIFRTRPGSAMRYGNWKLHEYFEDGRLELYDLNADIGERKNIATEMPEKARELHAMMKTWRAELNCPVPTKPNPDFGKPKKKPKKKKPVKKSKAKK
jgi:arylsulfatase A-like enzyme